MRSRSSCIVLALVLNGLFTTVGSALNLTNATTNNTAVGTVTTQSHTWDPGESLAITGKLWDAYSGSCETDSVLANVDSVVVIIWPPDDENTGPGHKLCGAPNWRRSFSPGTDGNGNFSFSIRGGGVSFLSGDGHTNWGSIVEFVFKEGNSQIAEVWAGTHTRWPEITKFACEAGYAPDFYGHLASPDFNADGAVDSSDLTQYAVYQNDEITRTWGWQSDFNHADAYVDASDLSYFAARLSQTCSSSKAGDGYVADVRNLERADVQTLMARAGTTATEVMARWDAWGWSYDRAAGVQIARASVERRDWGWVKQLFR